MQFSAVAIALAFVCPSAAFAKKKPIDLSAFRGHYQGTVLMTTSQAIPGVASAVVSVPKKGGSAVISYQATVAADGSSLTVFTTLSLSKNGSYQISDVGLGLLATPLPVAGNYQLRKGRFVIGIEAGGRTLTVTGLVSDRGKVRNLQLDFTFDTTVGTLTIENDLKARAK